MRVERIELVYHPLGSISDPLVQHATLGVKFLAGQKQYGYWEALIDESPEAVLLSLASIAHRLLDVPLVQSELIEGVARVSGDQEVPGLPRADGDVGGR